ncbi:hypothetical protein DBB34_03370 [Sphaerisporangium cinnabarinum]|nr:hypothetical protein [Sphaerisporangium cinnabarinum]PTU57586.1 hypothetical protein DBB34_03370 [Sphaerisporangium cinnabarinum]
MKARGRRLATVVTALALLSLAGCVSQPATDPGENAGVLNAYTVVLPDGRTVICVASPSSSSGVDCDWASAQ